MKKLSVDELKGFKKDKFAEREFLKSSFRYSGPGVLMFICCVIVLVTKGIELPESYTISLFVFAALGLLYEVLWFALARIKKPVCKDCGCEYEKCLNLDRPEDTEYLYLCRPCGLYFSVMHSKKNTSTTG